MPNNLDPDQDRRSVGPDLGPNCLHKLSADDKSHAAKYIDFSFPLHAGPFCILLWFSKLTFSNFQEHYQSVKQFDPDQDRPSVGSHLGPNCMHKLSADNKSRAVKSIDFFNK